MTLDVGTGLPDNSWDAPKSLNNMPQLLWEGNHIYGDAESIRAVAEALEAAQKGQIRRSALMPGAFMPTALSQEAGVIVQKWSQSMIVNGTPMQITVTLPCSVDGLCREALREKGRREGREYDHVFLSDWILTSTEGHLLDMTADVSTLPTTAPVYLSRKPGIGG